MEILYKSYLEKLLSTESFWEEALKSGPYAKILEIYRPHYQSVLNMINDLKLAFNLVTEIKDINYKVVHWEKLYDENAERMREVIRTDATLHGRNPYDFYPAFDIFELQLIEKIFELAELGWIGFMTYFNFLPKELAYERLDYTDWNILDFYFGEAVGADNGSKDVSPHIVDKMLIHNRWLTQRDRMIDDHLLFLRFVVDQDHPLTITRDKVNKLSAFLGLSPKCIEFISAVDRFDMEDFKEFEQNYSQTVIESDMIELKQQLCSRVLQNQDDKTSFDSN